MSVEVGWLWLYLGVLLMLAELAAPGLVVFFFGLSAVTVGALRLCVGPDFSITWQLFGFAVLSIIFLVGLRRMMKRLFYGKVEESKTDFDNDFKGRVATVTVAIEPPLTGRIMVGDAEWEAISDSPISMGANVRIVCRDNLTMKVEEISNNK